MKKTLSALLAAQASAVVAVALFSNPAIASHHPSRQGPNPSSAIEHVVVIVQENHSFDTYFGKYCQAPTGSNPSCNQGTGCCEAGPDREPATGAAPTVLDDAENMDYDPDHSQSCEILEINGGKMDRFAKGAPCSDPRNFAYANQKSASVYWSLADRSALADRYFQPAAGASSSNDMYLARAQFVFTDNQVEPLSAGSTCGLEPNTNRKTYTDPTIGDLLEGRGVSWAYYAEGYQATLSALERNACPAPDSGCGVDFPNYPCIYDPSDNPFQYYKTSLDNPKTMRDFAVFQRDLSAGTLPAVSFIKALGYKTEHPSSSISAGMAFVDGAVKAIESSVFASKTLVLITFDESGGFFDHIAPPHTSTVDAQPYGPRIPLIATGPFARRGYVSHVTMEHSSIVRFIEWNWLGGQTGQLQGRDAVVNNIGSLLDPALTETEVP